MILAKGKLYDTKEQGQILDRLEAELCATLAGPPLDVETVLNAFDALGRKIRSGEYAEIIRGLGLDGAEEQVNTAVSLFRRESLEAKLSTELGNGWQADRQIRLPGGGKSIQRLLPLGVLFHIAAGNVDGLPAYSVAEGLLTGNINLLKLPQADNGLSVKMLWELIQIEPALADFIYVFDTTSEDIAAMRRLMDLSDGVVTWGGDGAVAGVRGMASPGTRLIEWGHKLGFVYLVPGAESREDLEGLAEHLMETRQLLCSSCQVIYLDTEHMEDVYGFCESFLPVLEAAALRHPSRDIGAAAELTLRRYTSCLERLVSGGTECSREAPSFEGKGCSLLPKEDSELELSPLFGNCQVKRLPRKDLLSTLRRKKQYLQTAGLLCAPSDRKTLENLLLRAGLVKVALPANMSRPTSCEGHDGEFPLRRYLRVTDCPEQKKDLL